MQWDGIDGARDKFRRLSKQHARKTLLNATTPLRHLHDGIALSSGSTSEENVPIYGIRETGSFTHLPVSFGDTPAERPFDQSTVVMRLDNSAGTFRNMHAIDRSRRVLYEEQLPFNELPIALQRLEPIKASYPKVAYLSNTWVTNFYHWLFLVLPMLRFYNEAGIELEHLYVGEPLKDWQRRSLELIGIGEDMIVTEACEAEVAYVAMLTRHTGGVPPAQIRWTHSQLVKQAPLPTGRRLFVGRGEAVTRQMIDEDVIASALEREFGFEYITTSGMSLDDEIELFGQASAVVAPYGAALTNILFCAPGTKVLELTAYDNDFSISKCYQEMSSALGHRHGSIRGLPTPRRKKGVNSDILVPLDQVLREVEKMVVSSDASPAAGTSTT